MREFCTWLGVVLVMIFLAVILWFQPAHADTARMPLPAPTPTPTPTMSCVSSANVTGQLESHGAKVWPIEGLRAVRLLSIVNHMAPPTDYHAATVLAAFPPDGKTVDAQGQPIMLLFLVNNGCVENEKITLRVKVAIAVMRETFGQGDVPPFGRREITRIHDQWTNGVVVPPWVKSACCGPNDIHLLAPENVHNMPDGIHVDGLSTIIPYSKVLPSPDGKYWGFWNAAIKDPTVYCFFAPVEGF